MTIFITFWLCNSPTYGNVDRYEHLSYEMKICVSIFFAYCIFYIYLSLLQHVIYFVNKIYSFCSRLFYPILLLLLCRFIVNILYYRHIFTIFISNIILSPCLNNMFLAMCIVSLRYCPFHFLQILF